MAVTKPYHYDLEPGKTKVEQSDLQTLVIADTADHTFTFDLRDFIEGADPKQVPISGMITVHILPTLTAGVDVSSITAKVYPATTKPGDDVTLITAEDSIQNLWTAEAFTDARMKDFALNSSAFGPNFAFDVVLSYDVGAAGKQLQVEMWLGVS